MSQIKRILSAFVLVVLVVTGVNMQVGTGVANADCQGDWAAYWRQNSPGTPVPPMPPQWCQTQQPTQPTQTPLPTAAPTNTAIPSPVSPTPEPTTAPPSPTTAPQQSGNGAGAAPTPANPPETTKPFQLPGDATTPQQAAPSDSPSGSPTTAGAAAPAGPPATRARVPANANADTGAANGPNKPKPPECIPAEGDFKFPEAKKADSAKDQKDYDRFASAARSQKDYKNLQGRKGWQVDHLIPLARLWRLPGFRNLSRAQQLAIANHPNNLKSIPGPWNRNKSSQTPSEWDPKEGIEPEITDDDWKELCKEEKAAVDSILDQYAQTMTEGEDGSTASDTAAVKPESDSSSAGEAQAPAQNPAEAPAQAPAEVPAEEPAQAPVEAPAVTPPATPPAEIPGTPPAEVPAGTKPADVPAPAPAEVPAKEEPSKPGWFSRNKGWLIPAGIIGVAVLAAPFTGGGSLAAGGAAISGSGAAAAAVGTGAVAAVALTS